MSWRPSYCPLIPVHKQQPVIPLPCPVDPFQPGSYPHHRRLAVGRALDVMGPRRKFYRPGLKRRAIQAAREPAFRFWRNQSLPALRVCPRKV